MIWLPRFFYLCFTHVSTLSNSFRMQHEWFGYLDSFTFELWRFILKPSLNNPLSYAAQMSWLPRFFYPSHAARVIWPPRTFYLWVLTISTNVFLNSPLPHAVQRSWPPRFFYLCSVPMSLLSATPFHMQHEWFGYLGFLAFELWKFILTSSLDNPLSHAVQISWPSISFYPWFVLMSFS